MMMRKMSLHRRVQLSLGRTLTWLELQSLKIQRECDERCAERGHKKKLREGKCTRCGRVPGSPSLAGWRGVVPQPRRPPC